MLKCSMSLTAVVGAGLAASASSAAHVRYRAVEVQQPKVHYILTASAINESGMMAGSAGSSQTSIGHHATVWTDGALENLDETFTMSEAMVINNSGATAGVGWICPQHDGACTGFIARALPGEKFEMVGTLGGLNGQVLDINAQGDFVGWWYNPNWVQRAFMFTEKDGVIDLGSFGGDSFDDVAINDSQQVAGTTKNPAFQDRAFLYENGAMIDLGTFGGSRSTASDINNSGTIVGSAQLPNGHHHAFIYTKDGGMVDIHTLPQAIESRAVAINESGVVAGFWSDGGQVEKLFKYTQKDGMVDLGGFAPGSGTFFLGRIHMNESGLMSGMAVTNKYSSLAWMWSAETGVKHMQEIVVNGEAMLVASTGALNDAGQIPAVGVNPSLSNTPCVALLEPVAPADITADGQVNVDDLLEVINAWGSCDDPATCFADTDTNGLVNVDDLLAVVNNWG